MPEDLLEQSQGADEPRIEQSDRDEVNNLLDQLTGEKKDGTPVEPDTTESEGKTGVAPVAAPGSAAAKTAEAQKPTQVIPPVVAPTTVTPPAAAPAVTPPADKPDTEVDAIRAPKGISPAKLAEGWEPLKKLAKTRGEQVSQLQNENAKLKAAPVTQADPKIQEDLTKAQAELSRYRSIYVNETDPQFKAEFDDKISKNESDIVDMLKTLGLNEENVKKINEMGGVFKLPDAYWDKNVLPKLPMTQRRKLEKLLEQGSELRTARQEKLDSASKNFAEFEKHNKEQRTNEFKAYQTKMQAHEQALTKDIPWARQQVIPENATPEVKAQIEQDNKEQKEMEAVFQACLYPKTPEARIETALTVCLAHKLAKDLERADLTIGQKDGLIKSLQEELGKIKGASITANKSRIAPKESGATTTPAIPKVGDTHSDMDAIKGGLDAVMAQG